MAAVPSPQEVARQTAHIHEDRRNEVIVSHVVLITFAVTAVGLHFISRRIKSGVHADDWMMLFALVRAESPLFPIIVVHNDGYHRSSCLLENVPECYSGLLGTAAPNMPSPSQTLTLSLKLGNLAPFPNRNRKAD